MRTIAVCRWWGGKDWDRSAAVLAGSLRRHCPEWGQSFAALKNALSSKLIGNTLKLAVWADALDHLPNGVQVVLMDADLLVRAPLDPIWDRDFDLAFTARPEGARYPFNCGVVALRLSNVTRAAIRLWQQMDAGLWRNRATLSKLRAKYGGINQSALGVLLESGKLDVLRLAWLPCAEWNCEDSTWANSENARIVHLKDNLGRCALGYRTHLTPNVQELADEWRRAEKELTHG